MEQTKLNAANAAKNTDKFHNDISVRYPHWVDAIPEAVRRVNECPMMVAGRLLPIATLERIDGRTIENIVLSILEADFKEVSQDLCDDLKSDAALRKECVSCAQFAILRLLDYSPYVEPEKAEELYEHFYRQGDSTPIYAAKRAIISALAA